MQRLRSVLFVLGLAGTLARAATPVYVSVDVSTTETATSTTLSPNAAYRYATPQSYTLALSVPGNPVLSGIHKMDAPGNWLFSVESANDLGGALVGASALPADVIRLFPPATYQRFFCGAEVGVPAGASVDALCLQGGDSGTLLLSFDRPTTMGAFTFQPDDLARFVHTGPGCGGWTLAGANPAFAATAAGVPPGRNVIGVDTLGPDFILSFDVPTTLGATTYVPGQLVRWNGSTFSVFESLAGWPISSAVNGLSLGGNPGVVSDTIRLAKTAVPQLDTSAVILTWPQSCSEGASDYGIYEGTLGSWYSHTRLDCGDNGTPLTEQVTPGAGNRYYLVVPRNTMAEGSYGEKQFGPSPTFTQRPAGIVQCVAPQVVTPCPP